VTFQKHTPKPDDQLNQEAYRYGGTFRRPFGPMKSELARVNGSRIFPQRSRNDVAQLYSEFRIIDGSVFDEIVRKSLRRKDIG
jgi:hypothetical protein